VSQLHWTTWRTVVLPNTAELPCYSSGSYFLQVLQFHPSSHDFRGASYPCIMIAFNITTTTTIIIIHHHLVMVQKAQARPQYQWIQFQSVWRLATGWTVRGSDPGWGEIFRSHPDRPWCPSSLPYNGCWVFSGGKTAGPRRWPLTPHLAPRLKKEYSYTCTPSLSLRGLLLGELLYLPSLILG